MRIVFLGTPDFALQSLKKLAESKRDIVGVFTQPDKPVGRSKKLAPPPVKVFAQQNNIPVFQFDKIKSAEGVNALRELKPDLMVTAAFGQLLSQEILDIPKYGCINVHGSLLPKYRGAAPIQWAIINGEKKTGITTMLTNIGMDTGDMLLKKEVDILPDETSGELFDRLADIGAGLLIETLDILDKGKLISQKQDEKLATTFPMLKKQDGIIDWNKTNLELHNFVRGMNPWPIAATHWNGKKISIIKTALTDISSNGETGSIYEADTKNGLFINCSDKVIQILTLQMEGKKAMDAKAFLLGNKMSVGDKFEG